MTDMVNEYNVKINSKCKKGSARKPPEFKPGNTPFYKLGKELLNGKVNWLQTLGEILATGQVTLSWLSKEIGVETKGLALVLENNLDFLTFNAGARLLAVYERLVVAPRLLDAA